MTPHVTYLVSTWVATRPTVRSHAIRAVIYSVSRDVARVVAVRGVCVAVKAVRLLFLYCPSFWQPGLVVGRIASPSRLVAGVGDRFLRQFS